MTAPVGRGSERRRLTLTDDGPWLVEGPLEIVLPDGSTLSDDRPLVAICACGRSRRYPFCDTSHRNRANPSGQPGPSHHSQAGRPADD
ncbi:MAG: CDGSH iron-sulfur domain-containing protein [Acidimicrobiales bacterium]